MSATATLRQLPFFNYPAMFAADEQQLLSIVADVGRRGAFIMQRDLEEFEQSPPSTLGPSMPSVWAMRPMGCYCACEPQASAQATK